MAIAFVQQVGAGATTTGQTSLTSTTTTFTAGNLLVACVTWSYGGVGASATINLPSGWTDAGPGNVNNGGPNGVTRWFYLPNNAGGSQSWTWTVTGAGGATIQSWAWTILEFSGVATSSPLDLTTVSHATGASAATPIDTTAASGTTAATDLLLMLAGVSRSTLSITGSNSGSVPTSGWTVITQVDSSGGSPNAHVTGQYQIVSTGVASPRGEVTPSTTCSHEAALMTFLQAGAAPAALPRPLIVSQAVQRAAFW